MGHVGSLWVMLVSSGSYWLIAFVTIETVLLYSNFIMYKALATDAIMVKTWTRYFICHNALVPMS